MSYTVQSGDTFWSIAQKLGIDVGALQSANPGVNAQDLQVGQVLTLPGGAGTTSYTIVQGDTLWAIAQKFGTTLDAIEAANPGLDVSLLQIGQTIQVPGGRSGDQSGGQSGSSGSGSGYVMYTGPASAFPDPGQWASWDTLWTQNSHLMKFNDSDSEIDFIKSAINTVSAESGVDARVILCIVVQESGGNVRIHATVSPDGIRNPGLMQSHNGAEFNPADPAGSILQMMRDGTEGTPFGDGLKQCYAHRGNWYSAFREYNSGSVNEQDLNDPISATASYVRDAANRLMGHTWNGM